MAIPHQETCKSLSFLQPFYVRNQNYHIKADSLRIDGNKTENSETKRQLGLISACWLRPCRGHFSCDGKHCVAMATGGWTRHMFHVGGSSWMHTVQHESGSGWMHAVWHRYTTDAPLRCSGQYRRRAKAHCRFMKRAAAASASSAHSPWIGWNGKKEKQGTFFFFYSIHFHSN